jgi:hypothetical protein
MKSPLPLDLGHTYGNGCILKTKCGCILKMRTDKQQHPEWRCGKLTTFEGKNGDVASGNQANNFEGGAEKGTKGSLSPHFQLLPSR